MHVLSKLQLHSFFNWKRSAIYMLSALCTYIHIYTYIYIIYAKEELILPVGFRTFIVTHTHTLTHAMLCYAADFQKCNMSNRYASKERCQKNQRYEMNIKQNRPKHNTSHLFLSSNAPPTPPPPLYPARSNPSVYFLPAPYPLQ